MTLSDSMMRVLTDRGIDPEIASRYGLDSQARGGGEVLIFPFVREGRTVRRKYRDFRPNAERRWSADKGAERICWNEDCLRDPTLHGRPLIITEGELDALAAIQCGYPRTISVPDGAPPPGERSAQELETASKYDWLKALRPYLSRELCPEIIIASDGDENGAALLQDLSVLLGRFRCKFLIYPLAPKNPFAENDDGARLKDLNDVLRHYGHDGVVQTINRAQWLRVDGVFRMSELPPLPPSVTYDIRFERLSAHYRMRLGDFVVVTGVPGLGKTTWVNDVVCRVVTHYGLRAAWASFEQAPQRDHRRALRAWYKGDDRDRHASYADFTTETEAWIEERHVFIVPKEDDDVTLDWMLDRMEVAVVRHGAKIIIIDPWNEMDHARLPGETTTEYVGRSIKALKRFARQFQIHLIVVAHPTKSTKDGDGKYRMPTLYDISDSSHWYNKCDLGIIVHREKADATMIKVQKSKYHDEIGRPGEVLMTLNPETRHFVEEGF